MNSSHQILEEGGELLGKYRELEEGWAKVRVIPVHTVLTKLLQSLGVLLLILNMSWKEKSENMTCNTICSKLSEGSQVKTFSTYYNMVTFNPAQNYSWFYTMWF